MRSSFIYWGIEVRPNGRKSSNQFQSRKDRDKWIADNPETRRLASKKETCTLYRNVFGQSEKNV